MGGCGVRTRVDRLEDEVRQMQLSQRSADNLAFYRSRQRAEHYLKQAGRAARFMPEKEKIRFSQAKTQYHLTSAAYYYMLCQENRAVRQMQQIDEDNPQAASTSQWLEYRYLCGYYGYGPEVGRLGIRQCQGIAHQLAEDDSYWRVEAQLIDASLLNSSGDFDAALSLLMQMEPEHVVRNSDDLNVELFPESMSRLFEQMSVAYAGLGNKQLSDQYRNQYLDLLNEIREDKELPARKAELERRVRTVRSLFLCVAALSAGAIALFVFLSQKWRRQGKKYLEQLNGQLDDERRETSERYAVHQLQTERNKRDNIMRKTSLSIVTGVIPLIDRMRREILRKGDYDYVSELAEEIDSRNEVLSKWIQTRQGMVQLHIENFALQDVFDIVAKNNPSFAGKGINLEVKPTDSVVKADKALTLFMLNTLMDNARKFTPKGGAVCVKASAADDFVELSVNDTGVGLSEEEKRRILDEKVLTSDNHGFGILNCKGIIDKYRKTDDFFRVCRFGIDSEKGKGSRFWFRLPKAVRAVAMTLLLCLLIPLLPARAASSARRLPDESPSVVAPYDSLLSLAADFADSVYYANTEARYEEAFAYADSAFRYLNEHCGRYAETALDSLTVSGRGRVTERDWWMADFATDYFTILDLRNELAVASLALNRWADYRYNNKAYTTLYKLQSIDINIAKDCRRMQHTYTYMLWLIVTLLAVALFFLLGYYFMAILPRRRLHRIQEQRIMEQSRLVEQDSGLARLQFEENRLYVQNQVLDNCLSAIKHETIFYPSRIRYLVENKSYDHLLELVDYYSEVYSTLAACAARQLEESTFRRSSVSIDGLFSYAVRYFNRRRNERKERPEKLSLPVPARDGERQEATGERAASAPSLPELTASQTHLFAEGDEVLLRYLLEVLLDDALAQDDAASLSLDAESDAGFVRISLTDEQRTLSAEELHDFFEPSTEHARVLLRQIIREHDEYFDHPGCRIVAQRFAEKGGLRISFSIPASGGTMRLAEEENGA